MSHFPIHRNSMKIPVAGGAKGASDDTVMLPSVQSFNELTTAAGNLAASLVPLVCSAPGRLHCEWQAMIRALKADLITGGHNTFVPLLQTHGLQNPQDVQNIINQWTAHPSYGIVAFSVMIKVFCREVSIEAITTVIESGQTLPSVETRTAVCNSASALADALKDFMQCEGRLLSVYFDMILALRNEIVNKPAAHGSFISALKSHGLHFDPASDEQTVQAILDGWQDSTGPFAFFFFCLALSPVAFN